MSGPRVRAPRHHGPAPVAPGRRPLLLAAAALPLAGWHGGAAAAGAGADAGTAGAAGAASRPRATAPSSAAPPDADALAGPAAGPRPLRFPRDHGAHPDARIEWWYLTGWLGDEASAAGAGAAGRSAARGTAAAGTGPLGFQVTFFRARAVDDPANPSAFTARQLLIAHAALTDPARGDLLHDQRIARAGFGIAEAATADTAVTLDGWRFVRADLPGAPAGTSRYAARVAARSFTLDFTATTTQPLLLQGEAGWSRKGTGPGQASFYYSQPHLQVQAELVRDGRRQALAGRAWLDHEWSDRFLDPAAAGWDWVGMNLDDGSALTAFVIRPRAAGAPALYAYASLRAPGGPVQVFGPDAVRFEPLRTWTSARTRGRYPVAQRIVLPGRTFETAPLIDDQELDSRASAGAVYWEGASRLLEGGRPVGRGYLEMTGYVAPMTL